MKFSDLTGRMNRKGAWDLHPFSGPQVKIREKLTLYRTQTGRRVVTVRLRADAAEQPAHILLAKYGPSAVEALRAGKPARVSVGYAPEREGDGFRAGRSWLEIDRAGQAFPLDEAFGLLVRYPELLEPADEDEVADGDDAPLEAVSLRRGAKRASLES